jgi:hypothetical protein
LFSKPLPAKEFEALVTARPDSRQKVAIPDKSVKLISG